MARRSLFSPGIPCPQWPTPAALGPDRAFRGAHPRPGHYSFWIIKRRVDRNKGIRSDQLSSEPPPSPDSHARLPDRTGVRGVKNRQSRAGLGRLVSESIQLYSSNPFMPTQSRPGQKTLGPLAAPATLRSGLLRPRTGRHCGGGRVGFVTLGPRRHLARELAKSNAWPFALSRRDAHTLSCAVVCRQRIGVHRGDGFLCPIT